MWLLPPCHALKSSSALCTPSHGFLSCRKHIIFNSPKTHGYCWTECVPTEDRHCHSPVCLQQNSSCKNYIYLNIERWIFAIKLKYKLMFLHTSLCVECLFRVLKSFNKNIMI